MLTQGWRRYNIAELAHGRFSYPDSPVEIGPVFSGFVKSILRSRPVEDVAVTAVSFIDGFTGSAQTDKNGRFHLPVREFPDSTLYVVSVEPKSGMTRMELIIDKETFPERTLPAALHSEIDMQQFEKYANKSERNYNNENGDRFYEIPEVTITAQRQPPRRSTFYTSPSNSVTPEELETIVAIGDESIYNVLRRMPGVQLFLNKVPPPKYIISIQSRVTFSLETEINPLLLLDDMPVNISLIDQINPYDIEQIDLLKGAKAAIFGMRGGNGVIAIYTKRGKTPKNDSPIFHTKAFLPLGYQKPVEFYAPKYDTPEKRNATTPDLRTTIHWQPVVKTDDDSVASFEFYTADEPTTYTVVIEGLANDGSIIRKEEKLWRKGN